MSSEGRSSVKWTHFKIICMIVLYVLGVGTIVFGLLPFFNQESTLKTYANIPFELLILFFMFSALKIKKNRHFYLWAGSFGMVIFTDLMFIFYDDLFSEASTE